MNRPFVPPTVTSADNLHVRLALVAAFGGATFDEDDRRVPGRFVFAVVMAVLAAL